MDNIKILYVGINYKYINPTPALLPAAIGRCCDLYFFGPGYVSSPVLEKGISNYIDSLNGIDLLVVSKDLVGQFSTETINAYLAQFCRAGDGCHITAQTYFDIRDFLQLNRDKVVISLLDVDVYASFQRDLDSYMVHGSYFIGPEPGCCDFSSPFLERESYISRKKEKGVKFGLYDGFCRENTNSLICLSHIVGEHEFSWRPLALRYSDVSVPGAQYYRRSQIYKYLSRKCFKDIKFAKRSYEYPFKILNRLGIKPFSNAYVSQMYNLLFQRRLFDSKVCVTEGGLINFTIRKFLEIPAAGSLLVAWPTTNFTAIGFRHGENCVTVENNDDVVDVVRAVAKEPDAYQGIASAAQRMVMRQHSLGARGQQLFGAFERILAGKFKGSFWQDGDFKYAE